VNCQTHSLNPHLIKRLFKNVSASCLAANASDYGVDIQHESPRKDTATQPAIRNDALGSSEVQERDSERFLVVVTSVRKRLADEDGIIGKYHVDCLRYAGFIPDDRPAICSIRQAQRKCAKGEAEHTQLEVFRLWPKTTSCKSATTFPKTCYRQKWQRRSLCR